MLTTFSESGWAGRGQGNVLSLRRELSLNTDESQVDQLHEDVEKKGKYFKLLFSLKGLKFYIKKEQNKWTP